MRPAWFWKSNFCAASGRRAISPGVLKLPATILLNSRVYHYPQIVEKIPGMHRDHRKIPRRAAPGLDGPRSNPPSRRICSKRPATRTCSIGRSTTSRSGCKRAPDRCFLPYQMELNHPGAQAHRDHTGHQFAEMIVDHFEDLLEQSQPHGRARARTPADAAARTFLAHSIRVAPRGHRRPGGGQGRKRSTVGNALDTAVPNDPASFAPYLLARDPSRVVIHLASAVFGLRLATVRAIRG